MRRSDIFDSFVKIAEEKGLISKSSPEENKADLEKTHRADSLSIDDIAHLYGVKPDAPAGAKYKRNIIEVAHPEPQVIAPAYDNLNGLVENENERQNILLHIVNKTNDGSIVQRKYAEKQLIMSLVRVGNDMDNRGQDELCALADICLRQSSPGPIRKQAQLQVIIPLVAAVIGGIYAKQHLRFHSDGFERDYEKAVAELDDLINSNSNWGVGYEYKPEFIAQLNDIKNKLNQLNTAVQSVLPELDKLSAPKSGTELVQLAQQPNTHEALHALQQFKKTVSEVYPYLRQVVTNFSNEGFKQRQIENKGFLTNIVDSTDVLHGGKGLIADDFDDVVHALQTIFYDVDNIAKSLAAADGQASAAAQQLQTATENMPGAGETQAPEAAPAGSGTPPVQQVQTNQLEQEQANLERELAGNPDLT